MSLFHCFERFKNVGSFFDIPVFIDLEQEKDVVKLVSEKDVVVVKNLGQEEFPYMLEPADKEAIVKEFKKVSKELLGVKWLEKLFRRGQRKHRRFREKVVR